MDIHVPGRGQRSRHEQKGIPGEERRDDQPGLAEHDGEEDEVDPDPVVRHEPLQVTVEIQDDVDERAKYFQGMYLILRRGKYDQGIIRKRATLRRGTFFGSQSVPA